MEKFVIGKPFDCNFNFRETCFGFCEKNGKFLLTQKILTEETSLVGGGIEGEETHRDCLEREFKEETGYSVKSVKELCDVDCYWLAAGKYPMRSLAHFYIVKLGMGKSRLTEEGNRPVWVDFSEVKKLCPLPYHQKAIEYYQSLLAGEIK